MTEKIRMTILDDHPAVVDGYCVQLDKLPQIEVVDKLSYGSELEPALEKHPADVLLLDINVPIAEDDPNPYPVLHVIPRLLQKHTTLNILVISMFAERSLIKAVMEAGASGYILKDDQTAIALSNLLQTERLRKMYQDNINNFEEHRLGLALDLHDSILNQLAVLRMNLDETHLSPNFYEAYEALTTRLREIVSDLRPPMLNYGLKPALDELAENLMERANDTVKVTVKVEAEEGVRFPANIELHLFRIVQEACENTMHHAKASEIVFSGRMDSEGVLLTVEDNGIGFETGGRLELSELLSNKHFGLAGMIERGALIGAEVRIESAPKKGTRVRVTWKSALTKIEE